MTQHRLHRLRCRLAAVPDKRVRTELLRFICEASRQIARQDEEDAAFERWCAAEERRAEHGPPEPEPEGRHV